MSALARWRATMAAVAGPVTAPAAISPGQLVLWPAARSVAVASPHPDSASSGHALGVAGAMGGSLRGRPLARLLGTAEYLADRLLVDLETRDELTRYVEHAADPFAGRWWRPC